MLSLLVLVGVVSTTTMTMPRALANSPNKSNQGADVADGKTGRNLSGDGARVVDKARRANVKVRSDVDDEALADFDGLDAANAADLPQLST
jgi:hypothetical protein